MGLRQKWPEELIAWRPSWLKFRRLLEVTWSFRKSIRITGVTICTLRENSGAWIFPGSFPTGLLDSDSSKIWKLNREAAWLSSLISSLVGSIPMKTSKTQQPNRLSVSLPACLLTHAGLRVLLVRRQEPCVSDHHCNYKKDGKVELHWINMDEEWWRAIQDLYKSVPRTRPTCHNWASSMLLVTGLPDFYLTKKLEKYDMTCLERPRNGWMAFSRTLDMSLTLRWSLGSQECWKS